MALEVAVRNPERYEGFLRTYAKYDGSVLDGETILDIYTQLYLDGLVSTVATIITMSETNSLVFAKPYCTEEFLSVTDRLAQFDDMQTYTMSSLKAMREIMHMLDSIEETLNKIV